jgi:hypothetical protein
MESVYPFLLLVAPFAVAFLIEAAIIFFFRIRRFWAALLTSLALNLISLGVLYLASRLIGTLGYPFDGMLVPLQVLLFFWWLSILADGFLLQLFSKNSKKEIVFSCSTLMNTLSWLFLYFFIVTTR